MPTPPARCALPSAIHPREHDTVMSEPDLFRFAHPLRVRWAEIDMQGIVFNAHYLMYFDVAIAEYWRATGIRYPEGVVQRFGVDFFVVRSTLDYHASARYDEELKVAVRCHALGRSSMRFFLEVRRGAECLVSGEVVYVCADADERRSVPVPGPLRDLIEGFEGRSLQA